MPGRTKGRLKISVKARQNGGKNRLQTGSYPADGEPQGSAGGSGPSRELTEPIEERPGAPPAASPEKPSFSLENIREHPDEGDPTLLSSDHRLFPLISSSSSLSSASSVPSPLSVRLVRRPSSPCLS
eukprot:CAMPEP_0174919418 /NCGR_PEP_ID=MMETSP1355-20121228/3664_1 /TAXON_ID=464990 /ORGANISM="Hemiselmis tepida, Strain CCMP443" /LENGTH=126 /DNA_ID=CAMNT_0016164643 /DNA_START=51 /DNA_END=427 /DNA_ORIENTATION=+